MITLALLLAAAQETPDTSPPPVTVPTLAEGWLRVAGSPPYPPDAYRSGVNGTTGVTLHIDARGRVQKCSVVTPSGSRSLDDASCPWMRRVPFNPARDATGRAVESDTVFPVRWTVPTAAH